MTLNRLDQAYPYNWKNTSVDPIQAFAPLEVSGWEQDDEHGLVLTGVKPGDGDPENVLTGINGPVPVPASGRGVCACPALFWGAMKPGQTTTHGADVGGKKDDELLIKDETGFKQLGDQDDTASPPRALLFQPGGGGGGGVVVGRAMEYIHGGMGELLAGSEDDDDNLELDGSYDIYKGKVRIFTADTSGDPIPYPNPWIETNETPDPTPEEPNPPTAFRSEEWFNFMPDGILKNSLVIGIRSGGTTWIVSASATTLIKPFGT